MTWQEYQKAVGEFYSKLEKMGTIKKNVFIPDKITGQNRQIDVWWEIKLNDHQVNILIDAKMRTSPIDVKDVEEVQSLAESVKAHKAIIVTNSKWTVPAQKKAEFIGMDLKIISIEEALNIIVPNKWFMCYDCVDECVVMDWDGVLFQTKTNLFFDWQAGRCRTCKGLYIHCPGCGGRSIIYDSDPWKCSCDHRWKTKDNMLYIKFNYNKKYIRIDNAVKATPEFIYWLLNYPKESWENALVGKILTVGTDNEEFYSFIIPKP